MSYDIHCEACPYYHQKHLVGSAQSTNNLNPPVELEDNRSNILLVFQAPGEEEWSVGKPIQPTRKRGGTAGARIQASWDRVQKSSGTNVNRYCFDIIKSVQCFPGKNDESRDFKPDEMAVRCCSKRLSEVLNLKQYAKVIAFGSFAFEVISTLANSISPQPSIVNAPHPNGGLKNATLDALW